MQSFPMSHSSTPMKFNGRMLPHHMNIDGWNEFRAMNKNPCEFFFQNKIVVLEMKIFTNKIQMEQDWNKIIM
jgi:hypothetical protein